MKIEVTHAEYSCSILMISSDENWALEAFAPPSVSLAIGDMVIVWLVAVAKDR